MTFLFFSYKLFGTLKKSPNVSFSISKDRKFHLVDILDNLFSIVRREENCLVKNFKNYCKRHQIEFSQSIIIPIVMLLNTLNIHFI